MRKTLMNQLARCFSGELGPFFYSKIERSDSGEETELDQEIAEPFLQVLCEAAEALRIGNSKSKIYYDESR